MPTLVQLLASSSATNAENTILLLMRCRQFQIDGSEACLQMLPLVFSQDKSIYVAVEDAFIRIYLRRNPTETAANILNLAIESSIGDLAALEFTVSSLVSNGDISTSMVCLFDCHDFSFFAFKHFVRFTKRAMKLVGFHHIHQGFNSSMRNCFHNQICLINTLHFLENFLNSLLLSAY
ncbi:condensin-1 complex subunit CAP-D2-like [Magnolia sinica]|uniref:condensin-1 complex subunit CAP-D2-like n=1 Tax=Magnolia sinica TaxID=86752 RepID=UPI002657DA35|nr:condensin-1 complex subunit CAP-D2-like [Magnolia sinica]